MKITVTFAADRVRAGAGCDAIPDVVKTFSEQQEIKILKKIDVPVAHPPGWDNIRTWE